MNTTTVNDITENDLQAYVDEALPAEQRRAVADFLAVHPEETARLDAYRAQKASLKALFDPLLAEAPPARLLQLLAPVPNTPRPAAGAWPRARGSLERFAAALLIALFGGATGWLANDQYTARGKMAYQVPLARQAAIAHAVFTPDARRPVEVSGAQEEQLVAWLSKRLGTPIRAPKLGVQGYELVGGRLLPGNSGPVAQFMYQDAKGQRLTLFVSTENTRNQETAFRFAQEGSVKVFYWIDGHFGYALSAGIDKDELARLASAVYAQLESR